MHAEVNVRVKGIVKGEPYDHICEVVHLDDSIGVFRVIDSNQDIIIRPNKVGSFLGSEDDDITKETVCSFELNGNKVAMARYRREGNEVYIRPHDF